MLKKAEEHKCSHKQFVDGQDFEISPKKNEAVEEVLLSKKVKDNIIQNMNDRLD